MDVAQLKQHRVELLDENGDSKKSYNIYRSLVFETKAADSESVFHLCDASWFEIEKDLVKQVDEFLDPICVETDFPNYDHDDEKAYNKAVAASIPGLFASIGVISRPLVNRKLSRAICIECETGRRNSSM